MSKYEVFNSFNIAIPGAKRIGVYDGSGNKIGQIPLGNLRPKNTGKKLYSFGVLSDTHAGFSDLVNGYFKKALAYLADTDDVEFVCICGDLVDDGSDSTHWDAYTDALASLNGKPVYAVSGNHEQLQYYKDVIESTTGIGLIKSFIYHGDAFIMLGCKAYAYAGVEYESNWYDCQWYTKEELKQIHQVFEAHKDRRCFVFHHVNIKNAYYEYDIDDVVNGRWIPISFYQHYKNTTVFHGHTHVSFTGQLNSDTANYSETTFGCRSVHIPAIKNHCQFYIADAYQNGLHLQGYSLLNGGIIPYASYWVNTELKTVDANSYTLWE